MQASAANRLIAQVCWPAGLTVDADIDAVTGLMRLCGALTLVGLVMMAWRMRARHSLIAFGLACGLVALAPRFIVQTPRSYLNAHQFYVPLAFFLLTLVVLWERWFRRHAKAAVIGAGCALVVCFVLTARQIEVWRSPLTLWANAIEQAPDKPRPVINYAVALMTAGRFEEADRWFVRAMALAYQPHVPPWDQMDAITASQNNLQTLGILQALQVDAP